MVKYGVILGVLFIAIVLFKITVKADSKESENIKYIEKSADFYSFKVNSLQGKEIDFSTFKNKVVMIVNTASKCGFTSQFKGLETLYQKFKGDDFILIGIPSNDFGNQEPGSAKDIASFCELNYGVTFLMLEKLKVKGNSKHPLFDFLTTSNPQKAGNVSWNFNKFIIDKNGNLNERYGSFVKPLSKKIVSKIESLL